VDNTLTVYGQISNCFLAAYGENLADDGQKVAVTFQLFCGFEAFFLSYRKRKLKEDLSTSRLARPTALATAGGG